MLDRKQINFLLLIKMCLLGHGQVSKMLITAQLEYDV